MVLRNDIKNGSENRSFLMLQKKNHAVRRLFCECRLDTIVIETFYREKTQGIVFENGLSASRRTIGR